MSGIQSVGEPMEGAAINADSKQHTPTENVPPPNANANEESIPAEATNGDGFTPDFDFRSAAKKLKCDDDPDAVSSAIGIVLKELEDCKMKISFFETLFGYRTEHLMAYDEHILRYEDIRFYGQRRLKGRVLQQEMLRQNGHEPSLEELTGKVVVMSVPEDHYDFAVVLSLRGKGHVDRKLSKLQGQDVQIADNSAGAATEDVPADLQKKKLVVKKAVEKEKLQKILSQDHGPAGLRASEDMPPTSQDAAADPVAAHKTPTEEDAAPADDKEHKRKRAIVISDDDDDDRNAKASKIARGSVPQ